MKRIFTLLIIALWGISSLMAQDWKIVIFSDDKPAMEYLTSEIDSIIFEVDSTPRVDVADGWYIVGGEALTELKAEGRMQSAPNEAMMNALRPETQEIYVALQASAGFSIIQVKNSKAYTFGPADNFTEYSSEIRDKQEPQEWIAKGAFLPDETPFTVPTSGLYHIIIDTDFGTCIVAQANWGIIGSATPELWTTSTPLNYEYHPDTINFTYKDLPLTPNDFKFRYGNGWKVFIQNAYSPYAVNTNLGGDMTSLEPGGNNITLSEAGIYDVKLQWILGEGYKATMSKTGELPPTDWSGQAWDIVGDGVSAENKNASQDNVWNWGNQLWADMNGLPSKNEETYLYSWTKVVLESEAGFKLRHMYQDGSYGHEAGNNALNLSLSSDRIYGNEDENTIIAREKGIYNITLEIFANHKDSMSVYITKVENPANNITQWHLIRGNDQDLQPNNSNKMLAINSEYNIDGEADLFELYITLDSAEQFFLAGLAEENMHFGPGDDFGLITSDDLIYSEPQGMLYKGSIMTDRSFTCTRTGLYHIVLYPKNMQVAIAKTEWGIIGSATEKGWSQNIPMNINYQRDTVSFWLDSVSLTAGNEYKYRYNDGWRIYLHYEDNNEVDISAFANLGGSNDMLISGGDNIAQENTGTYAIELQWTLGSGFMANMTALGHVVFKDWSAYSWDAVGNGISDLNKNSYPDPLWNWGQRLWADGKFYSDKTDDLYTYTWTDVRLNANEGFKLRSYGLDTTQQSADLGFDNVLVDSSDYVISLGENKDIGVTYAGIYNITLSIDAANSDSTSIIITATDVNTNTIADGWYVYGSGTALDTVMPLGRMQTAINEALQEERAELLEIFVAAHKDSPIYLVQVSDGIATPHVFTENSAFVPLENRDADEIQGHLYKGTVKSGNAPILNADTSALYHIVYDTELNTCAIAEANWGIIGDATPEGWASSTPLNAAFDLDTMIFMSDSLEMYTGYYKYRYNNGWKIVFNNDLKVNANLGVDPEGQLYAGGYNIQHKKSGKFQIKLTWILGEGFSEEVITQIEYPLTDWSSKTCDVVGTGVSDDNANKEADPLWSWGNRLWAGGNADGLPTKVEDVYTYVWHLILEANQGFKLREVDNEAYVWDIGYSGINLTNSSPNLIDNNNNISVSVKGEYIITLVIDATNGDSKTVTIIEAE